ncbi:MAG: hypothetical protein HYY31_05660 [Chloroflexi bacterium]|nr:hypothetical protein [Chloroflexota bacterium]
MTKSHLVEMNFEEIEEQLKEAALDFLRFGRGRDRLAQLQALYRQYQQALSHDRHAEGMEGATGRPLAA